MIGRRPTRPRRGALVVVAVAVACLAGCGSGGGHPAATRHASTTTAPGASGSASTPHPGLRSVFMVQVHARVLVDQSGYALYMFARDHRRRVTCTATCALSWPPLRLPAGTKPHLGAGVDAKLVGTDPDPAGGPAVITYNGYPLYTYAEDAQPGIAVGQGTDINGGYWYVIRPDGRPLEHLVVP